MNNEKPDKLESFRQQIDALDARIIDALGHRFKICEMIALHKKKEGIPMMQHSRVEQVKQRCMNLGAQYGLDPNLVAELYGLIIRQSCERENAIIENQ